MQFARLVFMFKRKKVLVLLVAQLIKCVHLDQCFSRPPTTLLHLYRVTHYDAWIFVVQKYLCNVVMITQHLITSGYLRFPKKFPGVQLGFLKTWAPRVKFWVRTRLIPNTNN